MKNLRGFVLTVLLTMTFIPYVHGGNSENLLGITTDYDKEEITIHVVSTGCTQKKDFKFEVKNDTLTVVRVRKDECKAMGSEARFTYNLKEAGIDPNKRFIVGNKFIVNVLIANIH